MLEINGDPGAARRLRLRGELDLLTAPDLLRELEPLCGSPGDVVVDCRDLTFVDSQGIRAFLRAARALPEGNLVLSSPTNEVRKLFDIVRIQDFPNIVVAEP
jgi:anti-anti-sigma factor